MWEIEKDMQLAKTKACPFLCWYLTEPFKIDTTQNSPFKARESTEQAHGLNIAIHLILFSFTQVASP